MKIDNNSSFRCFLSAVQELTAIYEEAEARNILRIYFEDVFEIKNIERESTLTEQQLIQLDEAVTRLLQHEPIQYVIGEADFFGYKFKVSPAVLIPRPETEELVDAIIQYLKKYYKQIEKLKILDIGTGSGCIPITLKKKLPEAEVHAIDVSAEALAIAQENAIKNEVSINFAHIDILNQELWATYADSNFDIIVSNPPYIPFQEQSLMAKNVLDHEPHLALFVNDNVPLIFYNTIASFAQQKLKRKGWLYFECNEFNATEVEDLLIEKRFRLVEIIKDMSGKNRMVCGMN